MYSFRASPRWHLHHNLRAVKHAKRTSRSQHELHRPTTTNGQTAGQDPVEVLQAHVNTSKPLSTRPSSLTNRIFSSLFYAGLFAATGFAFACGWKTWQYLHTGKLLGLPATRMKNKLHFDDKINASALVQSLKKDGWVEEQPTKAEHVVRTGTGTHQVSDISNGQHLVNERLAENGYLLTRSFRHPTEGMTVLVFVADFACESWPNTLHGGIATTVIQEALEVHLRHFPGYTPVRHRKTAMNYSLPLHPGTVYSVLVQTGTMEYSDQASKVSDKSLMGVGVKVLLNEMDRAPRYVEKYNESTKINERILSIHDAQHGISAYVKGRSIVFLASSKFRELIEKNQQQLVPALQEKLDAWSKSHEYAKPKASKSTT